VTSLQAKDDVIHHIGVFDPADAEFEKDEEVKLQVDEEKRRLNARMHSAGHLLDMAMWRLGQDHLKPGKGYHFPQGAYVEYIGNVEDKEKLLANLNETCNKLIQEQKAEDKAWSKVCEYEEASKILALGIPDYIPAGSNLRVVKLSEEDKGCPCGGTHVKELKDIEEIKVTRVQKKGKNLRVSYTVKGAE